MEGCGEIGGAVEGKLENEGEDLNGCGKSWRAYLYKWQFTRITRNVK